MLSTAVATCTERLMVNNSFARTKSFRKSSIFFRYSLPKRCPAKPRIDPSMHRALTITDELTSISRVCVLNKIFARLPDQFQHTTNCFPGLGFASQVPLELLKVGERLEVLHEILRGSPRCLLLFTSLRRTSLANHTTGDTSPYLHEKIKPGNRKFDSRMKLRPRQS